MGSPVADFLPGPNPAEIQIRLCYSPFSLGRESRCLPNLDLTEIAQRLLCGYDTLHPRISSESARSMRSSGNRGEAPREKLPRPGLASGAGYRMQSFKGNAS
jgi:hypothetical protein